MFEMEITLNEFNRAYLESLLASLTDDQLDEQPAPGLHSARWILAHLAVVVDYGFKQLEMPFVCPRAWHAAYGPGTEPGTAAKVRPSREELMSVIKNGYSLLCDSLKNAAEGQLSAAHEVDLLKHTVLKTKGQLTAHILSSHFSTHLGQLSTLRRLMGFDPLF